MKVCLFCLLAQDAQSVSTAQTPSSSSIPAVSGPSTSGTAEAPTAEEQTSDQPAVTQSDVSSSSSPVDLSNKKSPEAESNTGTPSTFASAAVAQGKHQYTLLFPDSLSGII